VLPVDHSLSQDIRQSLIEFFKRGAVDETFKKLNVLPVCVFQHPKQIAEGHLWPKCKREIPGYWEIPHIA
jgi:hypothetical protein